MTKCGKKIESIPFPRPRSVPAHTIEGLACTSCLFPHDKSIHIWSQLDQMPKVHGQQQQKIRPILIFRT